MAINNILLVTRYGSSEARDIARKVAEIVQKKGANVYTVSPLSFDKSKELDSEEELKDIPLDLAIGVGGDGTVLRAVRWMRNSVPVFSIKLAGSRGILAETTPEEVESALDRIFANSFYLEKRMRVYASIDGLASSPALNEILINRMTLTRTPTYTIRFAHDELSQRMDGVLVSTPTGSTGHSFSLGGPVLHEGLDALVITPLGSVNRMPQLVVPNEQIEVRSNDEASIIVDGQSAFEIKSNQNIKIARYQHDAVFLRFETKGLRQLAKLGY
ncbi:MAG: NAD(+)/NADH kinase [Nitrososphaerales archaeon]